MKQLLSIRCFAIIIGISLISGCNNITPNYSPNIDDYLQESFLKNIPALIIASDITSDKTRQSTLYKRIYKSYSGKALIACCDVTLPQNLFINYFHNAGTIPSIVIYNPEKKYLGLIPMPDVYTFNEFKNALLNYSPNPEANSNYYLYKMYSCSKAKGSCDEYRQLINPKYRNPLYYYILSITSKDTLIQETYRDTLQMFLSATHDNKTRYLLSKLPEKRTLEKPKIEGLANSISFGSIENNKRHKKTISIANTGNEALIIYNVSVSCECISVNYPRIIDANHNGDITIYWDADSDEGYDEKTIYLITNSQPKMYTIRVNATIV